MSDCGLSMERRRRLGIRPDVCLLSVALGSAADDLGRHESRRAFERAGARGFPQQLFAAPEVGELARAMVVNKDILTLDVAVKDPLAVQILQALENIAGVLTDDGLFEGAILAQ
jgi:hypothetical protein